MTTTVRNRFFGVVAAATAAASLLLVPVTAASAEEAPPEDELAQVIDPNQAQGTGQVVLDDGHIDFGPTLNTGEWIIQIHDDTSTPSYWRMPSDVVAQVNDTAKLTAPDDPAYEFLGLEPGSEAWVIPQVRKPGVIWAGWNTQEPNVLDSLSMGTTLRILGVEGPGDVSVYLQSGNFGDPDPLWSTHEAFPQESWIESNTHTHANWVFSEPGVYLVQLEFEGELLDGTSVSAQDTLRFAVGDATDPEEAFAAEFDTSQLPSDEGDQAGSEDSAGNGDSSGSGAQDPAATPDQANANSLLIGSVVGVIGAALVIAVVVVAFASRRAKARARQARAARAADEGSEGDA